MNKEIGYKRHYLLLSALLFLGEGAILLPAKGSDEYALISFFLAAVVTFFLVLGAVPLANFAFEKKPAAVPQKTAALLLLSVVAVAAVFCAARSFNTFLDFSARFLLPYTPKPFLAVILGGVVLFFALKPASAFLKYALAVFFVALGAMAVLTLITASNMNIKNLFIYSLPSIGSVLKGGLSYLGILTAGAVLLPFFEAAVLDKSRFSSQKGIILGAGLSLSVIATPILIFSQRLAVTLPYPYCQAISTASFGRLFTRADGLAYILIFLAVTVKITACLIITHRSLKRINELLKI